MSLGLATACGSDSAGPLPGSEAADAFVGAAGDTRGTVGLVVVTHQHHRDNPRVREQLTGQAWFLDPSTVPIDEAARLVGAPRVATAPWDPATWPGVDACAVSSDVNVLDPLDVAAADEAVYLLDAGQLDVQTGANEGFRLDSRYLPAVSPQVSGVLYDGAVQDGRPLWSIRRLVLRGSGAASVGPFRVRLAPPPPMRLILVDRRVVRGSEVEVMGSVDALPSRPDGLRVAWQAVGLGAAGAAGGGDDRGRTVVLELVRRGFDEVTRVTCLVQDDGEFVVPAAALATLPDYGPDQTDRLEVSRVVRRPFVARGLRLGEAIVMTRDVVRLR